MEVHGTRRGHVGGNIQKAIVMKLYSRITGLLLSIAVFGFLLFCLYIIILDNNDTKGKMIAGFLLIPCIAFLFFMYLNRFGFNYKSVETQYSKLTMIIVGCSFIFIAIVPTYYLLNEMRLQQASEVMIDRGQNETNNLNFKSSLKTKYSNGDMLYVLNMEKTGQEPFDPTTELFLCLLDSDGFKIDTFEVEGYTYEEDSNGNLKAIVVNSSHYMNLRNYNRIKHWNLLHSLEAIPE